MKKRFNNSYELADYFLSNNIPSREWGKELKDFFRSNSYLEWLHCSYFSPEYKKVTRAAMTNFIDFIDKRLTFPLVYESVNVDCDGWTSVFKVTYTPDNQLSFDMSMV